MTRRRLRDEGRGGPAIESLADIAYKMIADRFVMFDIGPNESIHESQLSKEMQMGRTPIRKALHRLEHERLVVTHRSGQIACCHVLVTAQGCA